MKVMIVKNSAGKNSWYANKIGDIFEVILDNDGSYIILKDYNEDIQRFIDFEDCKEILDES